jgi:aspartate aminotransferase
MVRLADGEPVIVDAGIDQHFKITPGQLKAAITDRTRLVVINSPSNPTGVAYSREELAALAEVLLEFPRVLVATDDMYEHILWTEAPFCNILNVCPELYPRTIVLNGVSKAYSMTGWRIGYAGGPEPLIKAMKKIQSQSTSNPASISQAAAVAALDGDQSCIAPMLKAFKERHDFVVARLNELPGVECLPSDGTFYSFPNLHHLIEQRKDLHNDVELAEWLLQDAGVALVPGSAFGAPGYMRLSFATSMATLEDALGRLHKALIA